MRVLGEVTEGGGKVAGAAVETISRRNGVKLFPLRRTARGVERKVVYNLG